MFDDLLKNENKPLLYSFAGVAVVIGGILATFAIVANNQHKETQTNLGASMVKAAAAGKSSIIDGDRHAFWLDKSEHDGKISLYGQFLAAENAVCYAENAMMPPICVKLSEQPITFALDAMNSACVTARRVSHREYLKKYCPQHTV